MSLHRADVNVLGTSPENIDSAENRYGVLNYIFLIAELEKVTENP